jgi:hypothetical protein
MSISRRFAIWLLILGPSLALAQEDRPKENLRAVGTIRGVFNGGFQLATDTNEQWKVKLPDKASEVSFSGTADHSFLKPGMYVKFSAVMNHKGVVQGPITSLTVFTPLEDKDIGWWPEKAAGGGPSPLEGLFSQKEVKKEEPKGKGKKIEDEAYYVGGTLKSLKAGRMSVQSGGKEIKCVLAEDAKIKVATSDLSFAKLGDKVEVEGWYYANAKGGLWANQVSVTAANTLQNEKKKPKTDDEPAEKPKADDKKDTKK